MLASIVSCGGGNGGPPGTTPEDPSLTGCTPDSMPSEIPVNFTLTGTSFGPVGGLATVRFNALAGAPFSGGARDTLEVAASIDSETQISGTAPVAGISGTVAATVSAEFPSG
ncbi:MAG: hypothetical protein ACYTF8_08425, partial [Planctomycetota bacterium]